MKIEVVNPSGLNFVQVVHDLPDIKIIRVQVDSVYGRGNQIIWAPDSCWTASFIPSDWDYSSPGRELDRWGIIHIHDVPTDWWGDTLPDKGVPTIVIYNPKLEETEGNFEWVASQDT